MDTWDSNLDGGKKKKKFVRFLFYIFRLLVLTRRSFFADRPTPSSIPLSRQSPSRTTRHTSMLALVLLVASRLPFSRDRLSNRWVRVFHFWTLVQDRINQGGFSLSCSLSKYSVADDGPSCLQTNLETILQNIIFLKRLIWWNLNSDEFTHLLSR